MSENLTSREIALAAIEALEDKKGEDIRIIDISEVSILADYFIIASGNNRNQVQALCDNVEEKLGKMGVVQKQMVDYRDIVIHIFDKENRLFYDLERIWRDGKLIEKENL